MRPPRALRAGRITALGVNRTSKTRQLVTSPTSRSSAVLDLLLVGMVLIWAANYSIVKPIFEVMPPQPFNALRLILASGVFLALIVWSRYRLPGAAVAPDVRQALDASSTLTRHEWRTVVLLGLIGHTLYQVGFIWGLAWTSIANAALIIGCSPVAVAIVATLSGQERISRWHWLGVGLSLAGLYLVAGQGARLSGESLAGDLMTFLAVACWAIYTNYSRPLLDRHSPLVVTGLTMATGTVAYVLLSLPSLGRLDWGAVSGPAWLGLAASAILALNVAYLIWYISVQRIGSARTSVYSNLVPLVALFIAYLWLDERVTASKIAGALAILASVAVTRASTHGSIEPPPES